MHQTLEIVPEDSNIVSGDFVTLGEERFYVIRNFDRMRPFFISVISNADHWLFVSSSGGLTAGRVSPETALFPYIPVDQIAHSAGSTGSKTMFRIHAQGRQRSWEPFNREQDGRYAVTRNLYKNLISNKLCFEEINHDLQLMYRYTWMTSDPFGFIRQSELQNLANHSVTVEMLDGLQNILPADTPRAAQTNASNLVDAHKWTELDEETGLAVFTLYSGISDRAEPCESLRANTVFCLGLDAKTTLLSSLQIDHFRMGRPVEQENCMRGLRAAYFVNHELQLEPKASQTWQIVADVEKTQSQVVELLQQLRKPASLAESIAQSVVQGSGDLARLMATGDAFQATGEENVSTHHYANVLFNILRGGIFDNQNKVPSADFADSVRHFNSSVYRNHEEVLENLPETLEFASLLASIKALGDPQLERLCYEYLPIRFGRRHGDPSRPWNNFAINLKDKDGRRLLSFEGNWRDIFQNWEALTFSYPEFIENVIAKFVNASTIDGYNPYRITRHGIDWEVEEPDNPWSNIGYWGDHQIIYLQKLLELSEKFHPTRLREMLRRPIFCYANVPYRIQPFDALMENPKSTVTYDCALDERIARRVADMGADGKLVLDANGAVCQVNLLEKLLVPLLAKLGNLVIDGGIWLNTQRPEWNDANNALVGHGLSMVTLYYLRRYVCFLQQLLAQETESFALSVEVSQWLADTTAALRGVRRLVDAELIDPTARYRLMVALGEAASRYREAVYRQERFSGSVNQPIEPIIGMLNDVLAAIDHSIRANRREDGLYHSYNLLNLSEGAAARDTLYPMLEGQVAALSSGAISPEEAVIVLEALYDSGIYRPDQHSFMLYPDRELPKFLEKNRIPEAQVAAIPLLRRLLTDGNERIVVRDAENCYRFSAEFRNVNDLIAELNALPEVYRDEVEAARESLQKLYEQVFKHKAFTGRSGAMFGFEGLGSIYWHMVSKLLLAVQENFFAALDSGSSADTRNRLGHLYYRVREGIGFNKSPAEYGAFPTDPYSHTPGHSGARQPGMTGQVKEEVLSRFLELGVRVRNGMVHFEPALLRMREFVTRPREFTCVDVEDNWQTIAVPTPGLAFTWCQVPVIYLLDDDAEPSLIIHQDDGNTRMLNRLVLGSEDSAELFRRSGRIRRLTVTFNTGMLFPE